MTNDESSNRNSIHEDENLSTADLAGAGESPRTDLTEQRMRDIEPSSASPSSIPDARMEEIEAERMEMQGVVLEPDESPANAEAAHRDSRVTRMPASDASRSAIRGGAVAPAAAPTAASATAMERETGPLFLNTEANELRSRWDTIQVGFVDEPRRAVEQADNLVAGTMKRLAEMFADERDRLEKQWDRGEDISTEDLRQALRRYRSFFGRLLSV